MGFFQNIKNFFIKDTSENVNYLSFVLTPNEVLASIWFFNLENVEVLGFGQKRFENTDSLIHQAAVAIDKAGQNAKSDVQKVVFGLSHSWLEKGQPTGETFKILKELSGDLELEPQAFIPISSAVNHFLKVEESVTPNAVLVGIFGNFCEVHLLAGNNVAKTKIAQSPISIEKISQLIAQLKEDDKNLPARIIVYPADNELLIGKIKENDWKGLFVHEPKLDVLTAQELAKSVAYAQAADILGHEPILVVPESDLALHSQETVAQPNEFGFVEGEDILLAEEKKPQALHQEPQRKREDYAIDIESPEETARLLREQQPSQKFSAAGLFAKLLAIFKFRPSPKKLVFGLITLVVIALLGSFVASQIFISAEVTLKIDAQEQEKSFRINVVDKSSVEEESEIPGQEIKATSQGTQKAVATGSKKLGDKAKGIVKVLNWDKQPKTFPNGSEILTKNGLKFTLDGEVQVASRSAYTPGENKSGATASDFGDQYNIAQGVDFTIVGFDEIFYSAVSDTAFAGGSERQSTIVSKEDLERLEKSLTDTQTEKAKAALKEKAGSKKIHDEAVTLKILRKDFDKKVDEETSLVNLDMEIEANTIAYEESALKDFLARLAEPDVAPDLQVRAEDIKIVEAAAVRQKDRVSLSGKFRAGLIPKFNEDELKDKIAGKSEKEVRSILKTIPEVSDVLVTFAPNLPFGQSIPKNKSKIKFRIEVT